MTALQLQNPRIRYSLFALWLLVVVGALYLYFFQREAVQAEMRNALSASFWVAAIAYVLIGSFRAFTLVPATFPLLVAMPFFDPWVLLALTIPLSFIIGIVVSLAAPEPAATQGFAKLEQQIHFGAAEDAG